MGLKSAHQYYGDSFQVECPTGSGLRKNLDEVRVELAQGLAHILLRDKEGKRPVFGSNRWLNTDPYWRNSFQEYFHGDTRRACGASHQTGWTGLIAQILINLPRRNGSRESVRTGIPVWEQSL